MQLTSLEVETDVHEVITLLGTDTSKYTNLISDCRHLLRMLYDPVIRHAYREQNGVTDQLAKSRSRMQDDVTMQVFV